MKNTKKRRSKVKISAKTAILIFVLVCVVCLTGVLLLACNNGVITSDEALEIVCKDLGVTEAEVGTPHIHEDTYQHQPCYNVYVTVNGKFLSYVVSTKGEILHKGEGSHSH